MKLSDKTYNFLKWACLIAVPALITLISTLGTIYGKDTTAITATIGAVATFIGALIGVSNSAYIKSAQEDEEKM
ncbi:MAG: phage holin [Erysipelotrichaceae bacterium]|nr:phage holin [Lactimicrobium massiliense]MDD6258035.1 phage holin [Erysipelotrichaceae bacterium]MDD6561352.1 phage holin [Lactimicrobium massiliense]